MKKRHVFLIIAILAFIAISILSFNSIYNFILVRNYKDGDHTMSADPLQNINLYQEYVAYYNAGNVAYEKHDYKGAIENYKKALSFNPPEDKECPIRVNLVLASLNKFDWTGETKIQPDELRTALEAGREILLEKGCATDNNDGHDKDAQQLKNDIDKLLEYLDQWEQNSSGDGSEGGSSGGQGEDNQNSNGGEEQEDDEDDEEKDPEERLKDMLEQQRRESETEREAAREEENGQKGSRYNSGDIW